MNDLHHRPVTLAPLLVAGLLALAACGDSADPANTGPAGPSVADLYGRLTLNYRFDPGTTTFTDTATLSASGLSSDGKTVSGPTQAGFTRPIGCSLNTTAGFAYTYLCVIPDSSFGTTELFAFNTSGGRVTSGIYEFCLAGVSLSACTSDFVSSPDGLVLTTSGISAADRASALEVGTALRDKSALKAALAAAGQSGPAGAATPESAELAGAFGRLLDGLAAAPAGPAER
jgi:hypothetical protein